MSLTFFNNQGPGEKTEKATPKKREKARKEGQVAQSQEVGTAFLLISAFLALRFFAPMMLNRITSILHFNFTSIDLAQNFRDPQFSAWFIWATFGQVILVILPIAIVVMSVGLFINIMQVGWKPTAKPLKPKFSKLSPLKGIKKVFGMRMLMELFKAILKFAVILTVVFFVLVDRVDMLQMLLYMDLFAAVAIIADLFVTVGLTVGILYLFIAAADYAFNRRKHEKELRMSKQEVKEEWKTMEGDPMIKSRIKQKMREVSMRRMMQDVPHADVVITNPTHYACALRYDRERGGAPILVAKGRDHMARRIKDVARENFIVMVEDKPLARTLYSVVDVGDEVPPELWQAVAEVLAYVYRLKNPAS
jgi:flagellar biosynthetic protein FlhB